MDEPLLRALQAQRASIRIRWKTLLHTERITSPLADPDMLVYLFNQTLDEILAALPSVKAGSLQPPPACRCDCNPMRDYFTALEQALLEALILAQAKQPKLSPESRTAAVDELRTTLRRIAQREITVYDTLCQQSTVRSAKS